MALLSVEDWPDCHQKWNDQNGSKYFCSKYFPLVLCPHCVTLDDKDVSVPDNSNGQQTITQIDEVGEVWEKIAKI